MRQNQPPGNHTGISIFIFFLAFIAGLELSGQKPSLKAEPEFKENNSARQLSRLTELYHNRNEFPCDTYLKKAIDNFKLGLADKATQVLEQSPPCPVVYYWLAYLYRNSSTERSNNYLSKADEMSPLPFFPTQSENISVLEWVIDKSQSWKSKYYLGLIYWQLSLIEDARVLFEQCGDIPCYAPFYIARGILFQDVQAEYCHPCNDFAAAVKIDPGDWITWHYLINFLQSNSSFRMQLDHSHQAYLRFPANKVIRTDYARALVNTSRYKESIKVLDEGKILPEEGAIEEDDIFELANLSLAVEMMERRKYRKALKYLNNSGKWPENPGDGKTCEPDTRFRDYIAAYCYLRIGKQKPADILYDKIIECSLRDYVADEEVFNLFIANQVLKEDGKKQEADLAMKKWKTDQDSLFRQNISDGSASLKSQWLIASYLGEDEKAVILEKQISSIPSENRFRLFIRTLNYINKIEK